MYFFAHIIIDIAFHHPIPPEPKPNQKQNTVVDNANSIISVINKNMGTRLDKCNPPIISRVNKKP